MSVFLNLLKFFQTVETKSNYLLRYLTGIVQIPKIIEKSVMKPHPLPESNPNHHWHENKSDTKTQMRLFEFICTVPASS